MTWQFCILRKGWGFEICVQSDGISYKCLILLLRSEDKATPKKEADKSEDKAAAAKPENNKEIEIVEADQSEDG